MHDVHVTSPVFTSQAKVAAWAAALERSRGCIARSTSLIVMTEADGRFGADHGPWFGKLTCNQPRVVIRLIAIALLPWLVMNLGLMLLARLNPPVKRRGF